jgi:hypothetical protein
LASTFFVLINIRALFAGAYNYGIRLQPAFK